MCIMYMLMCVQMDELLTKCTQLEALCKARRAEAWQRSQDYLVFQERYNSVSFPPYNLQCCLHL